MVKREVLNKSKRGEIQGEQKLINGCSSIGRVAVSKTVGWEFESLHPCK